MAVSVCSSALKSRPITSLYQNFKKMAASGVPAEHDDYCLKDYKYLYSPDILSKKVAFISGGGSGIGFRIAELFMRHGCNTIIASRRMSKLEESAERLVDATGKECLPVQADVRKYDLVESAVVAAMERFGRIDILVNAAAGNFISPAASLSSNGFRTVLDIDTIGTFNVTKAVYEQCFKDHGGNIINISANLHYNGKLFQVHAGSAKAAIDAMTRHLAVEWGPQNIRVNCLTPGPIEGTEGMRRLGGKGRTARATNWVCSQIPLQRMGTRTEMAEAAIFLASPLSAYMTGSVLVVDGGSWMTSGRTLVAYSEEMSKL